MNTGKTLSARRILLVTSAALIAASASAAPISAGLNKPLVKQHAPTAYSPGLGSLSWLWSLLGR